MASPYLLPLLFKVEGIFSKCLMNSLPFRFQGKDLIMELDHSSLRLVDAIDAVVLNSQPIHSIRVWGVGRDNGR